MTLMPLAIAIVATTPAHALEYQSTTGACLISGQSSICSESYTRVSFMEATQVNIVHVQAIFSGPGYTADLYKNSGVSALLPSTWTAKVEHTACARAGAYAAFGSHWVTIGVGMAPADTSSFSYVWSCDCPEIE
jgi:hypothetical protein